MGAELVELHQDERLELLRAGLGFPSAAAGPGGLEADERALCAHVAALPAGTADAVWVKWAWVPPANYPAETFLRLVGSAAPGAAFISWICSKRDLPTRFGARAPLRVIKVKPAREMTADLLWDPEQGHWVPDAGSAPEGPPPSAGIWRCGWVRGRWEPKAPRAEKRAPSPEWLVIALEAFHRNPWAPEDLVAPLREQHAAALGAALSGATTRFLARQRGAVRAWLEAEGVGRARRVLDAGCGHGSQRVSGGEWVGVDRDPSAIAEARLRAPDATWVWCDFSGLRHPLTGERAADAALAPASFDFILCCHALTAAAASEEVWAESLASMAEAAAPGATLCVRALDPEQLFSGTLPGAALELPDGSWVRRLPPTPRSAEGAVPVRTRLAWAASAAAPRTEFHLPARHLAAAFSQTGWRAVEPAGSAGTTLEPSPWELWEGATVSLTFRRAG
jgi:SAM-dependent methyltransferase